MISNNIIKKTESNIFPDFNKNNGLGDKLFEVANSFYSKMLDINKIFNMMCGKGFKKQSVMIPDDNSIFDQELFFLECESSVKNIFIKDSIEFKIERTDNNEKSLISLKELKHRCRRILEKSLEEFFNRYDLKIVSHIFKLLDSDVETYCLGKYFRKIKEKRFDCFPYVLYQTQHSKFKKWLFKKENPLFPSRKMFDNLIKNYSLVKEPASNDIVIYMDEETKPIHFGVFTDSERVNSKWGSLPQIFSHPVDISPYGNSYRVFRKKIKN